MVCFSLVDIFGENVVDTVSILAVLLCSLSVKIASSDFM